MNENISNKKNKKIDIDDDLNLLDTSEPFVDVNMKALRQKFIKESLLEQSIAVVRNEVGDKLDAKVQNFLARILVDLHIIKSAYVEQHKYVDPKFDVALPNAPSAEVIRENLTLDMRGDITGRNWWNVENEGRWAGPESESSLLFPKLATGDYRLSIHVVNEIEPNFLYNFVRIFFDKNEVFFDKSTKIKPPCTLKIKVSVDNNHKFPFHTLNFIFDKMISPLQQGYSDNRLLSIRISKISFEKIT